MEIVPNMITRTFKEVGFKVDIENITAETLDRVIKRKNVNTFTVFNIEALMNIDEITEFNAEIITSNFVHLNSAILDVIRAQTDENSIPPLLSTKKIRIVSDDHEHQTYVNAHRTIIVSPRKRPSVSIVPGLRVATETHYKIPCPH